MKIRKIIGILFCVLIYLMSFSGAYAAVDNDVSTVVQNIRVEPYIPEGNAVVTITATIKVTLLRDSSLNKNPAIHLSFEKDSRYLLLENMTVAGVDITGQDRIKFDKNPTLIFTISGQLNADWSKNPLILKVGEVYNSVGNGNKKDKLGDVLINLKEEVEIISPLKVHVEENMDFGVIIAGQTVDTQDHSRTPAVIEIEGTKGKNIILTIPKSVEIVNKNDDKLIVNLRFRENKAQELRKDIKETPGKELTGRTEKVKIDGSLKTNQNNSGLYTGTFTVRAEYEN